MFAASASAASAQSCRLPGMSSMVAPAARDCTVLAGAGAGGHEDRRRHPARGGIGETAAPPLPEESSSTSVTPCARSSDSITEAPRSLNDPVGMNHSHFSSAEAPPITRSPAACSPPPC
jgi:hypothetical protein